MLEKTQQRIEPRETYFLIFKVIKNTASPHKKTNHEVARPNPANAAMAFPPLNFAKIG